MIKGGFFMIGKKYYIFLGVFVVVILIVVPVITNYLMFVDNFQVAGDEKTWIGYFGSFWGAIIGGVISGVITLLGVRLTIENQERKEFINSYPQKKINGDIIQDAIVEFIRDMKSFDLTKEVDKMNAVHRVGRFKNETESLLEKSAIISGQVYQNIRYLSEHLDSWVRYNNDVAEFNEWGGTEYNIDPDKYEKYIKFTEKRLEQHDEYMNNLTRKFLKLTGESRES
jgi:hypothetical protein